MEKMLQSEINRYICSRMLEDECKASKVFINFKYEKYYAGLKRYYKPISFPNVPELKERELNINDYYRVIRSSLYAKNMDGKTPIKTLITIYLVTKHLVAEYNKDNQGFQFCGWMNRVYDDNEIDWNDIIVKNDNFCRIL